MNAAQKYELEKTIEQFDDEQMSEIIEFAKNILAKKEAEQKSKAKKRVEALEKLHDLLSSEPCPWESEEEMIEELKEDRRRRAGMSFEEFHEQTKAMMKSAGIDYE